MNYTVRYYNRNPQDPQDRWTINRETVQAASSDEAIQMVEDINREVIDVAFMPTTTIYKDRHVPGKTCPICGITLTVNETQFKTADPKHPFITRRLVCPNWWTTGCQYKEKWTDEIEALLIQADAELALQPAEF